MLSVVTCILCFLYSLYLVWCVGAPSAVFDLDVIRKDGSTIEWDMIVKSPDMPRDFYYCHFALIIGFRFFFLQNAMHWCDTPAAGVPCSGVGELYTKYARVDIHFQVF